MFSKMKYKIAVFAGDGVGPELVNEGIRIIEKAAELDKFEVEWSKYPHGAEHYAETKEIPNGKIFGQIKSSCNAIYCGTFEKISDEKNNVFLPNLIREYFEQYVSVRPIKLLPSVDGPLANKTQNDVNFTIIKENTEDMYVGFGGMAKSGRSKGSFEFNGAAKAKFNFDIQSKSDMAYQLGILSRKGCERAIKYAFEYAKSNKKSKVIAVDKANALSSHNIWRESFNKVAQEYQGIGYETHLIDSVVMNIIRQPEKYEVIIAPSMFGDILSDLGTALQGGLAFGARANINPESVSMFEPIHGSASKLKGHGIINPIATIWAGALMLNHIGQQNSGNLIIKAIDAVLKDGRTRTQDLDGNNTTGEMGTAIMEKFVELHD